MIFLLARRSRETRKKKKGMALDPVTKAILETINGAGYTVKATEFYFGGRK